MNSDMPMSYKDVIDTLNMKRSQLPDYIRTVLSEETLRSIQEHVPEKYRLLPTSGKDWRAIDNVMASMWVLYTDSMAAYVHTLDKAMHAIAKEAGKAVSPELRIAIGTCDAEAIALFNILQAHFSLIREYGRDDNADFHIGRVINIAVPAVQRLIK